MGLRFCCCYCCCVYVVFVVGDGLLFFSGFLELVLGLDK
jgi:hypothetical protein